MAEGQTPFEADCERKKGGVVEFRNERARLNTCACGVIRACHWSAVEKGQCKRFRAMTVEEWASWIGVEI